MTHARRGPALARLAPAALAVCLAGCAGGRTAPPPTPFAVGGPDADLMGTVELARDTAWVDLTVSVPTPTLVFRKRSEGYVAVVRTSLTVRPSRGGAASRARTDTVRVATFAETRAPAPVVLSERFGAAPGRLRVIAEVEDVGSEGSSIREIDLEVPPRSAAPSVSPIELAGRVGGASGAVAPVPPARVPARADSLRARVRVYGAPGEVTVRARLLRLVADSAAAEPINGFTPSPGSLAARGVSRRGADTVSVARQETDAPDQTLVAEVELPVLRPGVYRIEMEATAAGGGDPLGTAERAFVVRPPGYPGIVGMGGLIEPLAYIATRGEMRELREARDPRAAFDRFWGGLFQDRRRAQATLRAYFERVEEANRLFASGKDGWKTDRGMAYVLFGPPERVEDRFNTRTWIYGGAQSAGALAFERTAEAGRREAPADVWTLQRSRGYESAWRRARRLWRSGEPP